MLKLPSLDLVFSSNRGELETPAGAHPADGSHPPSSTPPGQHVPKLPPSKGLTLAQLLHVDFMCRECRSHLHQRRSPHTLASVLAASPLLGSPLGRSRHSSSQSDLSGPPSTSSGLSFTACMSDFSLYVFHPYGAGKQKSAVTGLPPGAGPLGRRSHEQRPHSWDKSVCGRHIGMEQPDQFDQGSLRFNQC